MAMKMFFSDSEKDYGVYFPEPELNREWWRLDLRANFFADDEWTYPSHDAFSARLLEEKTLPHYPVFLQSGSPSHFRLIKEWLRFCDDGKCYGSCKCCPKPNGALPTRVIDVGKDKIGPDTVCLISTDGRREIHYVTLSHCWGRLTKEQKDSWCTTRSNFEARTQGFLVEQLPATFQDAIRVTREIGKRYLWIDSLCIIQGEGGDWETEAKKMETVFRNAYCTIAATSAEDSTKGFLNRPVEKSNLQYATVPESSHGKVYVCTSIDDFPGDVQEGVLNKRAWVLQERALSRRTIHFTKRQTYFECGGGVRCETLTYMRNEKLSFRSDPEFPHSITKRSQEAQIKLFQDLFAEYSNLGLTKETDRPVAIDSLATELAKALKTKVRYGIFEYYLHRSVLWHRSQDAPMRRLPQALPSWSWMAYDGQIKYSEISAVEWDSSVQLVENTASDVASKPKMNGYVLKARVRRLRDCEIKPEGPKHVIRDQEDNEVGHLRFDTQPGKGTEVRCAIMGRGTEGDSEGDSEEDWEEGLERLKETLKKRLKETLKETLKKTLKKTPKALEETEGDSEEDSEEEFEGEYGRRKYYVLFVTECATHSGCGKFQRVGMGWIQQRFILFDGPDDAAQIL